MRGDLRRPSRVDPWVMGVIEDFRRRIEERLGVRVEEIILFGSRARGDYRVDSDIDLVVVSRDWKGSILDRMRLLYRLWDYDVDATLIPLTPSELEEKIRSSITLRDASKYWIRVRFSRET